MCGFVGFVNYKQNILDKKAELKKMNEYLSMVIMLLFIMGKYITLKN